MDSNKHIKRYYYIANARIPTERAHGVHMMKMCEAFAALGVPVEFIVPKRINVLRENPFHYYNVSETFSSSSRFTLPGGPN